MQLQTFIIHAALFMSSFLISRNDVNAQISKHNLMGRWEMHQVFRGDREVTIEYLPNASRWISFDTDNTFVSDGETYERIQGRYNLDEYTGLLSFNLDLGFGQMSYWQVDFDGRSMTWTDRGNPNHQKIRIILVRDF
jgi:hypothetical protein